MTKDDHFPNVGFVCRAFLYSVRFLLTHPTGSSQQTSFYASTIQNSSWSAQNLSVLYILAKPVLTHFDCLNQSVFVNISLCLPQLTIHIIQLAEIFVSFK